MTRFEKLLNRFLNKLKDFKYSELKILLLSFGYKEKQGSGLRVIFVNDRLKHKIKLHKPHPTEILKRYQIDLIIEELKTKKIIERCINI